MDYIILSKLSNWKFGGVDLSDHPDYSDFYIESVDYDGKPMSEEQIKELHDKYPEFVYNIFFDQEICIDIEPDDHILERQEMEDFAQDGHFENMEGHEIL